MTGRSRSTLAERWNRSCHISSISFARDTSRCIRTTTRMARASLEVALAAASDPSNWDPAAAKLRCGVITTDSGDDEYETERDAAQGAG